MKVANYKRGYIERFNCVIHGTIYLQGKAELYTLKNIIDTMPDDTSYPWIKKQAISELNKVKGNRREVFHLSTTPTEFVAKKLRLKKYKQNNYQFIIEK
jgi:hypothetical protein